MVGATDVAELDICSNEGRLETDESEGGVGEFSSVRCPDAWGTGPSRGIDEGVGAATDGVRLYEVDAADMRVSVVPLDGARARRGRGAVPVLAWERVGDGGRALREGARSEGTVTIGCGGTWVGETGRDPPAVERGARGGCARGNGDPDREVASASRTAGCVGRRCAPWPDLDVPSGVGARPLWPTSACATCLLAKSQSDEPCNLCTRRYITHLRPHLGL